MVKTGKSKYLICILFVLFVCFGALCQVHASDMDKRVLFISSYSYGWETVPQQIEGVKEAFLDEVSVDYKFMDTKNATSPESMELFYQTMRQYLCEVKPYDGIIAGDDAAFQFVLAHREELFPGIPIAFEGINNKALASEARHGDPLISGVVEELSYVNTLELAYKLYPRAHRVVAVLDNSMTGEGEREDFYRLSKKYSQLEFSEINASEYSKEELGKKLEELNDDTILFYVLCSSDKEGNAYTSKEAAQWISSHAQIPVFTVISLGMGNGVLGGERVSHQEMGYLAAHMLKEEFENPKGKLPDVIQGSPRECCFDENVMRRFEIKKSDLPKGSTIINHQTKFWERNWHYILITLAAGIVITVILIRLILENKKKSRLNDDLQKAKDNFEIEAKYDMLTGLKNRAVFYQELQEKIDRHKSFGMILFDVDGFKNVNDTLGHNNGDVVLKELAKRCSKMENGLFRVYRLAGDEFTAIVEAKNEEVAKNYARMIKFTFKDPFILDEKEYSLHSSIGIAMFPEDGGNSKEIVEAADSAMYYVKNHGKNNIAFYREVAGKA